MPMIPIKLERKDELVRVVRCKNCAYWEKNFECWYKGSKHYHCYMLDICTDENFYCAEGKNTNISEKKNTNKIEASTLYGEMKDDEE